MKHTKLLLSALLVMITILSFLATSTYLYKSNKCTVVLEHHIKRAYVICYPTYYDFLIGHTETEKTSMYKYQSLIKVKKPL